MTEQEWLAERFEEHRTRLRAVAYRMLGSVGEADDAVQEAWLRLSRQNADEIENLAGWRRWSVAWRSTCCAPALRGARNLSARRCPSRSSTAPTGPTPSTKRCWPTRSGSRCWWCWRRSARPSGWHSYFTTCSGSALR